MVTGRFSIEALGRIGKAEARVIEGLLVALMDSDHWGRCKLVAEELVRLGKSDDIVIEILLRVMRDPHICKYFALVLMTLGKDMDRMIRSLLKELSDFERPVLLAGMRESGCIRKAEDQVIEILLRGAADSEPSLRIAAIRGLGKIGRTEDLVIEPLLKALNDDCSVCICAAETLGWLGKSDDRVIEALLKIVKKGFSKTISAGVQALGLLLNPKNCWKRIQEEVRRLSFEKPELIEHLVFEAIIKRIFFFVDVKTQRVLPQVCRKWRELYVKYQDEQRLQAAPELKMTLSGASAPHAAPIRFFGNSFTAQTASHTKKFEDSQELDQVELVSQRAINVCESHGLKIRCHIIPAEPDGDCGFTGTRRVLDLLGRADIALQMSRTQLITLVRDGLKKAHSSCKLIILQIFKADGILSDDENRAFEQWCAVFIKKGYWMQEAHFKFLSMVFNIEFCFYCVDSDKKILKAEPSYESLYEGQERDTRIVVNLLHMTVCLRDENTQLNHFDGLIINPTLEQEQKINLLLEKRVLEESGLPETEDSQYSQAEKKSIGL